MQPLPRQAIDGLLVEMICTQAHRNELGELAQIKTEIYARKLSEWPAEATEYACRKTRHWFPTWAELEEDIKGRLGSIWLMNRLVMNGRVRTERELEEIENQKKDREAKRIKYHEGLEGLKDGVSKKIVQPVLPRAQKCRSKNEQLRQLFGSEHKARQAEKDAA